MTATTDLKVLASLQKKPKQGTQPTDLYVVASADDQWQGLPEGVHRQAGLLVG
jgi:hypothetical protein